MLFEELLKDERAEGRAEGLEEGIKALVDSILALLKDKGEISDDLRDRIMNEKDLDMLRNWIKLAAKAESVDQFLEIM